MKKNLGNVWHLKKEFNKFFPGNYHYHINCIEIIDYHNRRLTDSFLDSLPNKNECHIFDFSDEPWGERLAEAVSDHLRFNHFQKYLILSHSLKYLNNPSYPNICYFPHNYYNCVQDFSVNSSLENFKERNRTYFLSCLNRKPRVSRIANYLKLIDKPYKDHLLLSMYKNISDYQQSDIDSYHDEFLTEDEQQKWNSLQLPTECDNDLNINHEAYSNSYINLVTEISVRSGEQFVTEKIYKPIASGQMFMLLGSTGSVAHLKQQGYDVFEDIIDYTRYDTAWEWRDKLEGIHSLLDQIVDLDWPDIYRQTQHRRLSNITKFYSGDSVRPYGNHLAERMSVLLNQNIVYNHKHIANLVAINS